MPQSSAKNSGAPAPENACLDLLKQLDKGVRHHTAPLASIDHPAFCVLSIEAGSASRVFDALHRLRSRFVDWNEMRLARRTEIARVIDAYPDAERRAIGLRAIYNRLFGEKGRLDFSFLAGQKYTDGRRILTHIWPTFLSGAVALVLFEYCPGGQIPLTDAAFQAARKAGLVGKQGTRAQLQQRILSELPLSEAVRLIQHLELQATGHPYGTDYNQPEPKLTRAGRAAIKAEAEARAAARPSMIPLPASASSVIQPAAPEAPEPAPEKPAPAKAPKGAKPSKKAESPKESSKESSKDGKKAGKEDKKDAAKTAKKESAKAAKPAKPAAKSDAKPQAPKKEKAEATQKPSDAKPAPKSGGKKK